MAETMVKVGEVYDFHGLTNQAGGGEGRTLTILGISVSGDVSFRVDMPDFELKGPGIASAPLSEVIYMIQEGIWEEHDG